MTSKDYFFGNHSIAKALESLKCFFTKDDVSLLPKLFPRSLPSSLDDLLKDIETKERSIAAYFTHEEYKNALNESSEHEFVKPYLGGYTTDKRLVVDYITAAKQRLDAIVTALEENKNNQCSSWYEQQLLPLEQIRKAYTVLADNEESPAVQRIARLHTQFEHLFLEKKHAEENEQKIEQKILQRQRITEKLDLRLLELKIGYQGEYMTDQFHVEQQMYDLKRVEKKTDKLYERALRVGISLEHYEPLKQYIEEQRKQLAERKKTQPKTTPLYTITLNEITRAEKEEKPLCNGERRVLTPVIYVSSPVDNSQVDNVSESRTEAAEVEEVKPAISASLDTLAWMQQSMRSVDEVPSCYQQIQRRFLQTSEQGIMYFLEDLPAYLKKEKQDSGYLSHMRDILSTSYQQGYLKHIAQFGLGKNKTIIERAIAATGAEH